MTYEQLAYKILGDFTDEQLKMDVTIRDIDIDEYFDIIQLVITEEDDVLDAEHPVLELYREESET